MKNWGIEIEGITIVCLGIATIACIVQVFGNAIQFLK